MLTISLFSLVLCSLFRSLSLIILGADAYARIDGTDTCHLAPETQM